MAQNLWYPYAQMKGLEVQNHVVRAEGVRLHLADGRILTDAISSWWSVIHGYHHPVLDAALQEQAQKFSHVMLGGLTHTPAQRLAERLVELVPGDLNHVFFADSGSVGMEVAMKMAVQYHRNQGQAGRTKFASLLRGYHGDTLGVMSLGDPEEGMHHLFQGALPEQFHVRTPEGRGEHGGEIRTSVQEALRSLKETLEAHANEIAAFVCEPLLQGAGGLNLYPTEYLQEARKLCDSFGILMIVDEVATGFGRTGTFLAIEQANIIPDILVLGKGLSAGYMGLSATIARTQVFNSFLGDGYEKALMHGPTYMGNALACSVALAGIEIFHTENYLAKIHRIEEILIEELQSLKSTRLKETRVLGACGVLEFHDAKDLQGLQSFASDRGVWLRPFLNVAYTMPAYIISEVELRKICAVLREWALQ